MDKPLPLFVVRVTRGHICAGVRSMLQEQLEGVRTVVVLPEGVELVDQSAKTIGKARVCPSCGSSHIEVHADFKEAIPNFKWACFDCGTRASGSLPPMAQSNEEDASGLLKLPVIDPLPHPGEAALPKQAPAPENIDTLILAELKAIRALLEGADRPLLVEISG